MENHQEDKPIIIRQHNAITQARYVMSALEKNIVYMLLAQLKDNDSIHKVYRIRVKDLEQLTDSQINYKQIRLSTEKLITRVYNIREGNKKTQVAPLTVARYEKGTGAIALKFSKRIRRFFFELKDNYTLFQFQAAMKLKSKNSKHLYEMFCQWRSTGTFRVSIKELKERLMLIDLETGKEEYEKFGLFASKVLEPAKKEINENTEITFDYTTKKTSRKITHIEFKVRSKEITKETVPQLSLEDLKVTHLEERLQKDCELDPVDAKQVVKKLPADKIEWVMKGILKKYEAREINSLGGYSTKIFKSCLKGVVPTFEKSEVTRKYVRTKLTIQTNQIEALESELRDKLINEFGLEKNREVYVFMVKYGGSLESLGKLGAAISEVAAAIARKEMERDPVVIFEVLTSKLNGQMNYQPSFVRLGERSNYVNTIESLVQVAIPSSKKQTESAEEDQIMKEKYAIWKELIGLGMEVKDADKLVKEHSLEALHSIKTNIEQAKNLP